MYTPTQEVVHVQLHYTIPEGRMRMRDKIQEGHLAAGTITLPTGMRLNKAEQAQEQMRTEAHLQIRHDQTPIQNL